MEVLLEAASERDDLCLKDPVSCVKALRNEAILTKYCWLVPYLSFQVESPEVI